MQTASEDGEYGDENVTFVYLAQQLIRRNSTYIDKQFLVLEESILFM